MIPTKLLIEPQDQRAIKKFIKANLTSDVTSERQLRYRAALTCWRSIRWPAYELDLRGFEEKALWDLWGIIPWNYKALRNEIARYLERSPLIKLAECAE